MVDERNPIPLNRYFVPLTTWFLYLPVDAEISSHQQGHLFMSFVGVKLTVRELDKSQLEMWRQQLEWISQGRNRFTFPPIIMEVEKGSLGDEFSLQKGHFPLP